MSKLAINLITIQFLIDIYVFACLSDETLKEEDIAFMQLAGMYPLNKFYTAWQFLTYFVVLFTFGGMVVKGFMKGHFNESFETAHFLLIVINMFTQFISYTYHHTTVENLVRAVNDHFFSYGDAMDGETWKTVDELAKDKRAKKKRYGTLFKFQILAAAMGLSIKPPLIYLISGHCVNHADGEDWLLFHTPVSMFVPFSDYWVGYILGVIYNYIAIITIALTSMATASSFIRFSEEILHQLNIIKVGLRNFTVRANHLYKLRYEKPYDSGNIKDIKNFDDCIIACLNKSVEHHATIIKYFADFKRLMFVPLFTVIFDGGALICMSTVLLLLSKEAVFKVMMPPFIAAELYYTYFYCSYGEQLTNAFSEISDQMYFDDWLTHFKVTKSYMIIIKAFTFYPKKLSAGGFTTPNRQNFGNVLRTAYSLLNFLVTQR